MTESYADEGYCGAEEQTWGSQDDAASVGRQTAWQRPMARVSAASGASSTSFRDFLPSAWRTRLLVQQEMAVDVDAVYELRWRFGMLSTSEQVQASP